MRCLAPVIILGVGLTGAALAQVRGESDIRQKLLYPWGTTDRLGADTFAETLLSKHDRAQLGYWFYRQEVLGNLAAEKGSEDYAKLTGYGIKGVWYAIGALGDAAGGLAGADDPLVGGLISVSSAVVGNYAQDYGARLVAAADERVATRMAISLNERFQGVIRPDGRLDVTVLRSIGDTDLGKLINDPEFIVEVGNPAILADLKGSVTISMLEASLKDTQQLRIGVDRLDAQITELDKGYRALRKLQSSSLQQMRSNGLALGGVERKLDATRDC